MVEAKKMFNDIRANLNGGDLDTKVKQVSESIDYLHSSLKKINMELAKINMDDYNTQIQHIGKAGKSLHTLIDQNSDSVKMGVTNFKKTMAKIAILSDEIKQITATINNRE
jgi:signal recognition particle GTPase